MESAAPVVGLVLAATAGLRDGGLSTETALAELASTDLRAALSAAVIVAAGMARCSPLASRLLDSLHADLAAASVPAGAFSVTKNHRVAILGNSKLNPKEL